MISFMIWRRFLRRPLARWRHRQAIRKCFARYYEATRYLVNGYKATTWGKADDGALRRATHAAYRALAASDRAGR